MVEIIAVILNPSFTQFIQFIESLLCYSIVHTPVADEKVSLFVGKPKSLCLQNSENKQIEKLERIWRKALLH